MNHGSIKSGDDLDAACGTVGLIPAVIRRHERRITSSLSGRISGAFEIQTPCRLENGGVVSLSRIEGNIRDFIGTMDALQPIVPVAFVPAAGAASRFLEPLKPLAQALAKSLTSGNGDAVMKFVREVIPKDKPWPLPGALGDLIRSPAAISGSGKAHEVLETLSWPKALFPCSRSGVTFLEAKSREHEAFRGNGVAFCGEVYVAPAGRKDHFKTSLDGIKSGNEGAIPHEVVEQDATLSTMRFRRDGSFVCGPDGKPSVVPAGHGALVNLFPAVRKSFPAADYLLIRNVDNVCGTSPEVCREVARFCDFSSALIRAVRHVRRFASAHDWGATGLQGALRFMLSLCPETESRKFTPSLDGCLSAMAQIQRELFHSLPGGAGGEVSGDELIQLFSRPVNVLGQVPNSGKDIGGTPVFAVTPDGKREKVCIEVAHVSPAQVDSVLRNPAVATHFNPVFVASELVDDFPAYSSDHPYWSCVHKKFEGEDVFYHESFLYEILGSSSLSNVVFVEIPRSLFNPHKTLDDAASASVTFAR